MHAGREEGGSLNPTTNFGLVRKTVRLSVRPSVSLHGTTRLPQHGFSTKFDI
jgi:hypothetical protein